MNWHRVKTQTGFSDDSTVLDIFITTDKRNSSGLSSVRANRPFHFFGEEKLNEAFRGVFLLRIRQKNLSQISPHPLLLLVVLVLKSKVLYSSHAGGWTLVKRVIFSDGLQPRNREEIQTIDYRIQLSNYSSNLYILVTEGLKKLRSDIGFQQFRFYCRKATPGRVFHITTKTTSLGEAVVQYFTGNTSVPPQACDSFTAQPDDNSTLSGKCMEWGYPTNNTWGKNATTPQNIKMYKRLVLWRTEKHAVAMGHSDYFCDDLTKNGTDGDTWEFYVR